MERKWVLWIVAAVLLVAIVARRMERGGQPAPARTAHVPEAPAPSHDPRTPPAPPPSQAEPPPPPADLPLTPEARERQALEDMEKYFAKAEALSRPPDPAVVKAECLAEPRLAAERWGKLVPERPGAASLMAAGLCRRDFSSCERFYGPTVDDPVTCPNPPCPKSVFWISANENVSGTPQGCREWTAWMLFIDAALQGRTDMELCRVMLVESAVIKLSQQELGVLCPLYAEDNRTGGDSFCREFSSKTYGGQKIPYDECWVSEAYVKGEAACAKVPDSFGKPSCRLRARTRLALAAKDKKACADDPLCLAFLSGSDCREEKFVDLRNPGWKAVCEAVVAESHVRWLGEVDSEAQSTIDLLQAYRRNLPQYKSLKTDQLAERIDVAIAKTRGALARMEKERSLMNQGRLPSSNPPPKK